MARIYSTVESFQITFSFMLSSKENHPEFFSRQCPCSGIIFWIFTRLRLFLERHQSMDALASQKFIHSLQTFM